MTTKSSRRRIRSVRTSSAWKSGARAITSSAGEAIRRQLDAITLPEVQDFIREFVPSFSLTLDELNQPGGHQA